jgi:hypothetical protein
MSDVIKNDGPKNCSINWKKYRLWSGMPSCTGLFLQVRRSVALVGESWRGKSTVVQQLLRF